MVQNLDIWMQLSAPGSVLQLCAYAIFNCISVTTFTVVGIGAAVVLFICIEVAHGISNDVDASVAAIFTASLIQDMTIGPVNAIVLRKHLDVPTLTVAAVLWMGGEVCGTEVMAMIEVEWVKRIVGMCLALFLALHHGVPWLQSFMSGSYPSDSFKAGSDPTPCSDGKVAACKGDGIEATNLGRSAIELGSSAVTEPDVEHATFGDINVDAMADNSAATKSETTRGTVRPRLESATTKKASGHRPHQHLVIPQKFQLRSAREWTLTVYLGLAGGFLRGLCAAPLLALAMFVVMSRMQKDQWRATSSALNATTLPMRIYYYWVVKGNFDTELWPHMIGTLAGCLLGLPLGFYLAGKVNQVTFWKILNVVVVVGAVLLMSAGMSFSVPLGIATFAAMLLGLLLREFCFQRTAAPPAHPKARAADDAEASNASA